MELPPTSAVWSSAAFLDEATSWVDAHLARHGLTRTEPAEQFRVRPWSTQLRVVAGQQVVWFKACVPAAAYEAGITGLLAQRLPGSVLTPLAVDRRRGWLLLPDGGPVLREVLPPQGVLAAWPGLMRSYAALQRDTEALRGDLVAVGVPLLGPSALVAAWAERVDGRVAGGVDRGVVAEAAAVLRAAAGRLDAGPVPWALQHDDFHAGNVFAGPEGRSQPVVFDWGDASFGHPFSSLLIALRALPEPLTDDARIALVDEYLAAWAGEAPLPELRSLARDAVRLGGIARLLAWERALSRASETELAEWGEALDRWLSEITVEAAADAEPW